MCKKNSSCLYICNPKNINCDGPRGKYIKYYPVCVSRHLGEIRHLVDNKGLYATTTI